MGGIGVIGWNSNGEIVGGLNWRYRSDSVMTLETATILEEVRQCVEKGWTLVKIE